MSRLISLFFRSSKGSRSCKAVPGLSDATAGAIDRALASREIQGKPYELFLTPVTSRMARHACRPHRRRACCQTSTSSASAGWPLPPRSPPGSATSRGWRSSHRLPTIDAADAVQVITEGLMLAGVQRRSLQEPGPRPVRPRSRCWSSRRRGGDVTALERAMERGRSSASPRTWRASCATSPRTSSRPRSSPSAARRSLATPD